MTAPWPPLNPDAVGARSSNPARGWGGGGVGSGASIPDQGLLTFCPVLL